MIKVTATGGGWLLAGEVVTKHKVSYIGAPSPIILDTWILHCGYKLGHEDTWILSFPFTIDILRRTEKCRNRKQSPTVPECSCLLLLSDRHLVLARCDSIDLFINISLYYFSVTSNKQKCKLFRLFLLPPFQWPSS